MTASDETRYDSGEGRNAYMKKRVGVMLMTNLADALRHDELPTANSELYWFGEDQYFERAGGVRVVPGNGGRVVAYARANNLHPIGVVLVDEDGTWHDLLIDKGIATTYRGTARHLLRTHLQFWLGLTPLTSRKAHC
jgi:hypothetical protein